MAEPDSALTWAPAPFETSGKGDIILRSSDNINFQAHQSVLSLASSVFDDLFDIPQGEGRTREAPIITVSESSATLHALLSLIYPVHKVPITTFPLAFDVIAAADKYLIDLGTMAHFIGKELVSNRVSPLEAYAISWRLMLPSQAQDASRYLHHLNLDDPAIKSSLIIKSGSSESLLALWSLRHRRELALTLFMEAFPTTEFRCQSHPDLTAPETRNLRDAMKRAFDAAPHPVCTNVTKFFNLQSVLPGPRTTPTRSNGTNQGLGGGFGPANSPAPTATTQHPPTPQPFSFGFGVGGPPPTTTTANSQPQEVLLTTVGVASGMTTTNAAGNVVVTPSPFTLLHVPLGPGSGWTLGFSSRGGEHQPGCSACREATRVAKSETILAQVGRAIDIFPQDIIWPKEYKFA